MAKLVIHAYTQDENNPRELTSQELLLTVAKSLRVEGYVAWIDVVDTTNETTYKHEDKLKEEE